jgi:phosphoglycerate dehydrogenase-like enzyme
MSEKPVVVVLDDFENVARQYVDWSAIESHAELRIYREPLRGTALIDALQPASAVALMRDRTPFNAALIDQLPKLKLVTFTGTRNNTLDTKALAARNIPVVHSGWGPNKDATTELTWALILAAQKRIVTHNQALRAGQWRSQSELLPVLHGQTIGVVGLGEIGGRVAAIAKAFGMNVVTWSPNMTAERAAQKGASAVSFDELLAASHIISTHLVVSDVTRGLFGAKQFAAMRPDAVFVNTSRSTLVQEHALIEALQRRRPAIAALDVYDQEPLPQSHPLFALPNVVLTPHLGFVCEPVFKRFYADTVEALTAWLEGRALPRVLDGA